MCILHGRVFVMSYLFLPTALMSDIRKREEEEKEEEEKNKTLSGQCCACPPSAQELKHEALEREMQIQFQDFLQNQVYIKRSVTILPC